MKVDQEASLRHPDAIAAPQPSEQTPAKPNSHTTIGPDWHRQMIEEAAYLRAEKRGFSGGDPVADWLMAEAEIDELLAKTNPVS
jgi:hypothetical protein